MKKTTSKSKVFLFFITAFFIAASIPGQASAGTLTYDLDYQFAIYGNEPEATAPWATLVIDDSYGGANTARFSMTATNLGTDEFISQWYFNFDSSLDASLLTVSGVDISAVANGTHSWDPSDASSSTTGNYDINMGNDLWQADGDGMYDLVFNFPTGNSGGGTYRFKNGETVIVDVTYTEAIDVNSFNFFSGAGGGEGTYNTAAHVQNIIPSSGSCNDGTTNPTCSGWIANSNPPVVPEPVSSTLFLIGGTFLAGRRFFRRKK